MKLLIVTCLKEDQKNVAAIFEVAAIKVFSVSNTIGHKEDHQQNLLDNWFASGAEEFDSLVLFSFTGDQHATTALNLIKKFNEKTGSEFPIRGFILPVESCSY